MHPAIDNARDLMLADLGRSGLTPEDIQARIVDSPERAVTGALFSTQGYVIPYFNLYGKPVPFYRCRFFDYEPKYRQPRDTANYVYFPKGFHQAVESPQNNYVILMEGEKKAAIACKLGFPAAALGGVDSWRNRTVSIPQSAELTQRKETLQVHLPAGATEAIDDWNSPLALGLQDLMDYILKTGKHFVIIYDSDRYLGVKPAVQRAAASLAFELRFRGIRFDRIRQIILPSQNPPDSTSIDTKTGLDDLLVLPDGPARFQRLLTTTLAKRSAFPVYPSIRDYINKRLQAARITRKEIQAVSMAILSDLDANGVRLRSTDEQQPYYFDLRNRRLTRVSFVETQRELPETPFGQFLYREYGLASSDQGLIQWLGAQFTGEDPVEEVTPHRVIARHNASDDCVYYQISDAQFVKVDKLGITLYDNGEQGILFESNQVQPLDAEILLSEFKHNQTQYQNSAPPCWWQDILQDVRLREKGDARTLIALLYYISPWLYKWRGVQLPIELMVGEAGSGKSTLCELRLAILSGIINLRNAPQDIKDWHASISNCGGLHVTDNVQLVDKQLRQRLSDDICRIITESNPYIEARKYYTNAELIRIPVRATFTMTSITQPFMNVDILQRAIIVDFEKPVSETEDIRYDSMWRDKQLNRFGGREIWVAHHLYVLHRFLQVAAREWNPQYLARHRLIHLEQSLLTVAKVFNLDASWLPSLLSGAADQNIIEADWTLEGIQAFSDVHRDYPTMWFTATEIAEWAQQEPEYERCDNLTNPRRLGRYLASHKGMISQVCGLVELPRRNNRLQFKVVGRTKK